MSLPLITAHSGCENTPPNTEDYVKRALELGADIVEVDVRQTKDGKAVLYHDNTIMVNSEDVIYIDKTDYEFLQKILKKNGCLRILSLEEAFIYLKSCRQVINLDLKTGKVVNPVIELIKKYDMETQVIITGCGEDKAKLIKEKNSKLNVLLNVDEIFEKNLPIEQIVQQVCKIAIDNSCCAVNIEYKYVNEYVVDYLNKRCLPVFVWTVNDEKIMEQLIKWSVSSITTMEINKLKQIKSQKISTI